MNSLVHRLLRFARYILFFVRYIFLDKMPLQRFSDYNEYWIERSNKEGPVLLYRYKFVAENLPDDVGTVLDVGCGNGAFLKYLAAVKPSMELIGCDVSEVCVNQLREQGVKAFRVDLEKESLIDRLYENGIRRLDCVAVMEVLEHIYHAEEVMEDVLRLSPKVMYVTIPNLGWLSHRLRLTFSGRVPITNTIYHIREHIRFWTAKDFIYWANSLGFSVARIIGQGGFPLLWRFWPTLFSQQIIFVLVPTQVVPQFKETLGKMDEREFVL